MLIKCQANSHKPIQQTFILLRVHQYILIEKSAIAIYMCILIEYSSIVNILGVTGSF